MRVEVLEVLLLGVGTASSPSNGIRRQWLNAYSKQQMNTSPPPTVVIGPFSRVGVGCQRRGKIHLAREGRGREGGVRGRPAQETEVWIWPSSC